jgi:hypothetical protein
MNDPSKQVSEADCTLAVGYGFHDNTIVPCPVGECGVSPPTPPPPHPAPSTPIHSLRLEGQVVCVRSGLCDGLC